VAAKTEYDRFRKLERESAELRWANGVLKHDFDKYRCLLWKRGIKPMIARRGVAHGSGLGKVRWVVERAFARLHRFERLRTRYERRADLHQGLLEPACTIGMRVQAAMSVAPAQPAEVFCVASRASVRACCLRLPPNN
jgi:hypothetical protein